MARDTREVWLKRVERLADSGLTAKEFAAEIGVNANTLAGWRWRLGQGEQAQKGPARLGIVAAPEDESGERASAVGDRRTQEVTTIPETEPIAPMKFVELTRKTAAVPTQVAPFEIVLGSGRVVRVPGGFDAAELARLVGVLEEVRS
jgi:transposase-like protein